MKSHQREVEHPLHRSVDETQFAVIDVETTGLYPSTDRIVEVAVVVTDRSGKIHNTFETLVNPMRDVGPTSIHGVTAGMVAHAPGFEEVAGDLLEVLVDTVWVGHNIAFDLRFLNAEFSRLGIELPEVPSLCTMRLFGCLGPSVESHKLSRVCEACGVQLTAAHSAAGDAEATAMVLTSLLRESEDFEISTLQDLSAYGLSEGNGVLLSRSWVPFQKTGKYVARDKAGITERLAKGSYITGLIQKLRPSTDTDSSDGSLGLYLNLLDRVLEDRQIDRQERDELLGLAREWDLSKSDVCLAHTTYLGMMVGTALDDGVITDAELLDLEAISDLLAIRRQELIEMIEAAETRSRAAGETQTARDSGLAGSSVCFTGQTPGPSGVPISRKEATELAETSGLTVQKNVTKALDVLVVADPDTQSSKARKARAYGTRIIAAPVFWQKLWTT